MKQLVGIGLMAMLAACGGNGSSDDSAAPAAAPAPLAPQGPVTLAPEVVSGFGLPEGVIHDAAPGEFPQEITFSLGGASINLRIAGTPRDGFAGYVGSRGSGRAIIGEAPALGARALLLLSSSNGLGVEGTRLERLTETTVPVSGSAIYLGSYSGTLRGGPGMTGDVILTADFAQSVVSGAITNRKYLSADIDALVLSEAPLVSGAFSGETSGGSRPIYSEGSTGAYEGLIVGADGEGVVGAVRITHSSGPDDTDTEMGIFLAAE
jgi:hypothetical protein